MRAQTTVADLASTAVITVGSHETLRAADAQMRLADVRHLPVVDAHERLVGILSNRDLLKALGEGAMDREVRAVMSEDVVFVRAETYAYEAAAVMLDRRIGALPVVDAQSRVTGILTETDFLRVAFRLLGGGALAVDD